MLLEVRHLSKRYSAKAEPFVALSDVSLTLKPGEIVALLGPNGAGKTTLSAIIASLISASSGEVLVDGQSIFRDLNQYRRRIGYCPQKSNLNSQLNLKDNLLFSARFYGLSKSQAQQNFDNLNKILNLTPYLEANPATLSGGWKQRFMLARALMNRPELLILDEPTVGLDPEIRRQIWSILKQFKSDGLSILLTTHYLDEAEQLADWVCILDKGQIKFFQKPQPNLEEVYLDLVHEEGASK